jgi:hypothetical protein
MPSPASLAQSTSPNSSEIFRWCHLLVARARDGLTRQPAARLGRPGVTAGRRAPVVRADGAGRIRARYEGLAVPGKVMVLGGYRPRKRCYQQIGGSGPPKTEKKLSPGRPLAEAEGPETTPAGGWNAPRGAPVRDRQEKNRAGAIPRGGCRRGKG